MTFPKTQQARCLLTNAPPGVDEKQMKELQVRSTYVPKSSGDRDLGKADVSCWEKLRHAERNCVMLRETVSCWEKRSISVEMRILVKKPGLWATMAIHLGAEAMSLWILQKL